MLEIINRRYLITSLLIYLVFLPRISADGLPIYLINLLTVFTYSAIIFKYSANNEKDYNIHNLKVVIFIYGFFSVAILNILSFSYEGNFFVFSTRDAYAYHIEAIRQNSLEFWPGIKNYLQFYSYEDLGAVLFISSIYYFIQSNLAVNFVYLILGVFTAVFIFSISINFMERRYAFLAALTYSLSSVVLWFHSSGLKESVMVTLVVSFFYMYYSFLNDRGIWKILLIVLISFMILLFRPVIMYFCIISVGVSTLFVRRKGILSFMLLVVVVFFLIYLSPVWELNYSRFLYSGDINRLIESREAAGLVTQSFNFTLFVNILAQTVGPLPSVSPDHLKHLSIYSVGLIYRVLLSIPFWFGVYFIFKLKQKNLYPILLFIFFEMFALVALLEGLELRKSLPQFPMIYIVAFWFISKFDTNNIPHKKLIYKTLNIVYILLLIVIVYWNYR